MQNSNYEKERNMDTTLTISLVLIAIMGLSYAAYKNRRKVNMKNPKYTEQLKERELEYRRQKEESRELDDIVAKSTEDNDDYKDE